MRMAIALFTLLFAAGAFANPIPEGYAGLDQNDDFVCEPSDMGFDLTAGDQGSTFSVHVYYDMLSAGLYSFGCTFCVQEKALVTNESFAYSVPDGWTSQPMANSIDDPILVSVSEWITAAYPDCKCFVVASTDYSLSTPLTTPFYLGTFSFTYAVAADDCIGFVIDGAYTGYFSSGLDSGVFDSDGQTCPPYDCEGTTATQPSSWGAVKTLFR